MGLIEDFSQLAKNEGITNCYIIASNYRSGSTLLSLGLRNTGVAGSPNEYFTYKTQHDNIKDIDSFKTYLQKLYHTKKTENGMFGTKIMYPDLKWLLKVFRKSGIDVPPLELLETIFPNLKFVYISRKDRLRQAISMVRSAQSMIWHVESGSEIKQNPDKIYYDEDKITNDLMIGVIQAELNWKNFFETNDITPYKITYEDFVETYEDSLREIVEFLYPEDAKKAEYPAPPLKKMADEITEEWANKYLQRNQWLGDSFVRYQLYSKNNYCLALFAYLNQYKDPEMRSKTRISLQLLGEDVSYINSQKGISQFLPKLKRKMNKIMGRR